MRNIILSLVMVVVLVAAGVGGTLANMSDTEMTVQNSFATGSLDLMVWDSEEGIWNNDPPYGTGVQHEVEIDCAYPDEAYWDIIWVANFGDCVSGDAYFKIKNVYCENVTPTCSNGDWAILDEDDGEADEFKPEPEMVEEEGGVLDQHDIPASVVDDLGDDCCMISHTMIKIIFDETLVLNWTYFGDLDDLFGTPDGDRNYFTGMDWTALGHLPSCGEVHEVHVGIKFPQLYDPNWTKWENDDGYLGDVLFQDHPTNAFMLDKILFDIEFGLVDDGNAG
jgi:predicted ribosomally synthesized peptide with SipW-like signal peptide